MNYKEFQERQANKSPIREKKPFNWEALSNLANPFSILAVISMLLFFKNLPIIPGILSLITAILFFISWKKGRSKSFLPLIWIFNSIIWLTNAILR